MLHSKRRPAVWLMLPPNRFTALQLFLKAESMFFPHYLQGFHLDWVVSKRHLCSAG